ncbi:hypothetical protein DESA109040_15335 [Deinococcus saxicola]
MQASSLKDFIGLPTETADTDSVCNAVEIGTAPISTLHARNPFFSFSIPSDFRVPFNRSPYEIQPFFDTGPLAYRPSCANALLRVEIFPLVSLFLFYLVAGTTRACCRLYMLTMWRVLVGGVADF